MKLTPTLCLALVIIGGSGTSRTDAEAPAATGSRVWAFDSDPHWEGVNNRMPLDASRKTVQDFGYSSTNHAGERAGEVGGRVTRSAVPSFYAKPLEPAKTFDDKLSATGTFAITSSSAGAGMFIGFFNADQVGGTGRPVQSLGFDFDGEYAGGRLAVRMINAVNQSTGSFVTPFGRGNRPTPLKTDGTRYTFSLTYDPAAADGRGEFVVTVRGNGATPEEWEGKPVRVVLPAGFKSPRTTLTHFGMMNLLKPGGSFTAYVDDVSINGGAADHFDQDPHWAASNNRATYAEPYQVGRHDFGYSPGTHYAGGRAPGEIGGALWRTERTPAYYAARLAPLNLRQPLRASGRVNLMSGGPDSDCWFGWFGAGDGRAHSHKEMPFLGAHVGGPTRVGHYFQPVYTLPRHHGLAEGRSDDAAVFVPGRPADFSLEFDPSTRRLTATLDGRSGTLVVPDDVDPDTSVFDHFGLVASGPGGQMVRLYLDDLSFTGSPTLPLSATKP